MPFFSTYDEIKAQKCSLEIKASPQQQPLITCCFVLNFMCTHRACVHVSETARTWDNLTGGCQARAAKERGMTVMEGENREE